MKTISLLLLIIFSLLKHGICQVEKLKEIGLHTIYNFSDKDFKWTPQNWQVTQDKRGVIYVCNNSGVMEFDGETWRHIELKNGSLSYRIFCDSKGLIYVGGGDEFGFLKVDSTGLTKYVSLSDKLAEKDMSFGRIREIIEIDDKIFIGADEYLFSWDGRDLKTLVRNKRIGKIFNIKNELAVTVKTKGLCRVKGENQLEKIEVELASKSIEFNQLTPYAVNTWFGVGPENKLYLVTFNSFLNKIAIEEFKHEALALNKTCKISSLINIGNNEYAVGTEGKGVFVINSKGKLLYNYTKELGIKDDIVYDVFKDKQSFLWLSTSTGLTKIDIGSPITQFNERLGLDANVEAIVRYEGKIFLGTQKGLYTISNNSSSYRANQISNVNQGVWSLQSFKLKNYSSLLLALNNGIYELRGESLKLIAECAPWSFTQSKSHPNIVYVALDDGIMAIKFNGSQWEKLNIPYVHKNSVRFIYEDKDDVIWLSNDDGVLTKLKFNFIEGENIKSVTETHYSNNDGLPENTDVFRYPSEKIFGIVGTGKGLFKFDNDSNKYFPFYGLGKEYGDGSFGIHRLSADNTGKIWMVAYSNSAEGNKKVGYFNASSNSLKFVSNPYYYMATSIIHAILHEANGVSWFGGAEGLYRLDNSIVDNYGDNFQTIIRSFKWGQESLFNGNFFNGNGISDVQQNAEFKVSLPFSKNSFQFVFSAIQFGEPKSNLYSYKLEGLVDVWSNWQTSNEVTFTNLHEGKYRFCVKTKNVFELESEQATYEFQVLPPWYRTWWFITIASLMAISIVWFFIKSREKKLISEKVKLEETVLERTKEVVEQKRLIEVKHREITDSINYAERIQKSFLATEDILKKNLNDYFVFFKPKDVVSGDFYWATELSNGQFAIVNADSTGHGVPGAIMSILNISCLENSLKEGFVDPAEILNHTRSSIIERLKKDGSKEGGKDGMDASLICFDFPKNKFNYATANNPIWIVRANELIELKPDKMPVGKHDKDQIPFTANEFQLKNGDVVYTLTDGMPDQFGGPNGKKFMYRSLKNLLVEIANEPMYKQREKLNSVFAAWKGELEQIDDVCIIGIRV